MSQNPEEIDLSSVYNSIKAIVLNLLNVIISIIKDSIFNFKRLFILTLICVSIGLGLFFIIKPAYKSQMIIEHKRFSNDQCEELINQIKELTKDNQIYSLAKQLNISTENAAQIKSIEYLPLNERLETLLEDSIKVLIPFKVEAKVYDNAVLPIIEKGIIYYLTNNEFVASRENVELEFIDKMDKQIDTQIKALDSLKSKIIETLSPRVQASGVNINEPIDPVDIYLRELDLYKTKFDLQKDKQLNASFELVQGFSENETPYNSDIKYTIIISLSVGYLVSLLLSIYYQLIK